MKINEITKPATILIKEMESLYITYSTVSTEENKQKLWQKIEENLKSSEVDVRKQAEIYQTKAYNILLVVLKK